MSNLSGAKVVIIGNQSGSQRFVIPGAVVWPEASFTNGPAAALYLQTKRKV